jgi:hypothetical protein
MNTKESVRRGRRWAVGLAAALAIVHPGCGNDNNDNGPETFTDSATLGVLGAFTLQFTAQRNGTVDANVNWNDGNNDVDIYATVNTCPSFDALLAGNCSIIASSESSSDKPERLTFNVTNGTIYNVWAFNLGPGTDTVTITLTAD